MIQKVVPAKAKKGFVSLVGAGPGDPGLLTRRGEQRLLAADVVVYDALVSQAVVQLARPGAEVIHRQDIHDGRQVAISAFLIERARAGSRVVRLKGGDPFVFGRGGEEAEALARAGIPFEVVPGVTAGVAVPAYAGIPVTHRGFASDVTFVTGHEDPDKPETTVEWDKIVRTGGTLVLFMSVRRLEDVVQALRKAGAGARLPVAVIEWGTTPRQRTVEGVLEDIVGRVREASLDHPALVVIGRVVSLRRELAWFDRRPLWGERVLVTRARDQAPPLVEALRDAGAGILLMPVLAFEPPADPGMLDATLAAFAKGEKYDVVIFTSANGVRYFFEAMRRRRLDSRAFHGARVACVGPVTAEVLSQFGIVADVIPEEFRAEELLRSLSAGGAGVRGKRFLLLRAEIARNVLPDSLREGGAIVDIVPCYRTVCPEIDRETARRHVEMASVVTFTSPSSVTNLCRLLGEDAVPLLAERRLAVIGPLTARALVDRGLTPAVSAHEYTTEGLVAALIEHAETVRGAVSEGLPPR